MIPTRRTAVGHKADPVTRARPARHHGGPRLPVGERLAAVSGNDPEDRRRPRLQHGEEAAVGRRRHSRVDRYVDLYGA